jgi:hypothetical protein
MSASMWSTLLGTMALIMLGLSRDQRCNVLDTHSALLARVTRTIFYSV